MGCEKPHSSRTTQLLAQSVGGAGEGPPTSIASLNSSSGSASSASSTLPGVRSWEERLYYKRRGIAALAPKAEATSHEPAPRVSQNFYSCPRGNGTTARKKEVKGKRYSLTQQGQGGRTKTMMDLQWLIAQGLGAWLWNHRAWSESWQHHPPAPTLPQPSPP